jgi:hypothetical protein
VLADANVTPTSSNELAAKHTNADTSDMVNVCGIAYLGSASPFWGFSA